MITQNVDTNVVVNSPEAGGKDDDDGGLSDNVSRVRERKGEGKKKKDESFGFEFTIDNTKVYSVVFVCVFFHPIP